MGRCRQWHRLVERREKAVVVGVATEERHSMTSAVAVAVAVVPLAKDA
jgi:hypothetical protein